MSRAQHRHTMPLGLGFAFGASRGRPSTAVVSFRRRRWPIRMLTADVKDGFRSRAEET